jgi:MFS family permease
VSLVGSTVGYAGQATATTFGWMVFFRTIQGLFGGVPPVALAWVTDVFPPSERPKYLAGVQATIATAFVAGAVLGGTLSSFGLRAPMCFACVVSLAGLVLARIYLRDPADLVFDDEQSFLARKQIEDDVRRASRTFSEESLLASAQSGERLPLAGHARGGPRDEAVGGGEGGGPEASEHPWKKPRCVACGALSFLTNIAYGGASVLLPLFVLTQYDDLPEKAAGQVSGRAAKGCEGGQLQRLMSRSFSTRFG